MYRPPVGRPFFWQCMQTLASVGRHNGGINAINACAVAGEAENNVRDPEYALEMGRPGRGPGSALRGRTEATHCQTVCSSALAIPSQQPAWTQQMECQAVGYRDDAEHHIAWPLRDLDVMWTAIIWSNNFGNLALPNSRSPGGREQGSATSITQVR